MGHDPKDRVSISERLKSLTPVFEQDQIEAVKDGDKITLRFKQGEVGRDRENCDIIKEVNDALSDKGALTEFQEFLKRRGFEETVIEDEQKRVYRKRDEFPDPSKPRWASVNRTSNARNKKEVKLRLPPSVLGIVNDAAEKKGQDRTSWMTAVFLRAVQAEGHELSPELQEILDDLKSGPI